MSAAEAPAATRAGEGRRLLLRLVRDCAHAPGRLLLASLALAGVALAQLYLTWLVKRWLEGPLAGGSFVPVRGLLLEAAAVTSLMVGVLFFSRYLVAGVNQTLMERLRNLAVRRVLDVKVTGLRHHPTGDLIARVFNDTGDLSGFVETFLKRLIGDGLDAAGCIAVMFYLEWRLALATAFLVPPLGLLLSRIGRVVRRWGALAQREVGDLHATFSEQLHGMTTIKGYRAEPFEASRFAEQNARYRRRVMRAEWWSAFLLATVFLLTGLGLLGAIWWGSRQTLARHMAPAGLLAFCLFAGRTIEPIRRLSDVHGMLQRSLAAASRVYEVIDFGFLEPLGGRALPCPVRGELRLSGLRFRYRPDRPLLEGVDLALSPSDTVALVAASGGGKSTLANLLQRFLEPAEGRILLDGADLQELSVAEVRTAIRVVEQEPFLFRGPLADSLRYGTWDAPRAALEEAVEMAGLTAFVRGLPGGLSGVLTEAGRNLSGGQKQRIALARAIVSDPRVLVLDEATSALDSETEAQIFARLAPWLSLRTVLVMAHRLSTVSRFSRIAVLDAGRVVAVGTAAQLLQSCPAFGALFAEQVEPVGTLSE